MSTFQVVRVANGDTIQVRSGVLQGIGPAGPIGPTGAQGAQGDPGPQGEVGPMGSINAFLTQARVGTEPISVGPNTDQLVTFSTVDHDELSAVSGSNFAPSIGDYHVSCWVEFSQPADGGDGAREVWLASNQETAPLAKQRVNAVVTGSTTVELTTTWRTRANELLSIHVLSTDAASTAIVAGRLTFYRIGSGPKGDQGEQGEVGPIGPQGLQGAQGIPGDASAGFATIDSLDPNA